MKFALFLLCIGALGLFVLKTVEGVAPVVHNHNALTEVTLAAALGN